jgi:hypothetical protein
MSNKIQILVENTTDRHLKNDVNGLVLLDLSTPDAPLLEGLTVEVIDLDGTTTELPAASLHLAPQQIGLIEVQSSRNERLRRNVILVGADPNPFGHAFLIQGSSGNPAYGSMQEVDFGWVSQSSVKLDEIYPGETLIISLS